MLLLAICSITTTSALACARKEVFETDLYADSSCALITTACPPWLLRRMTDCVAGPSSEPLQRIVEPTAATVPISLSTIGGTGAACRDASSVDTTVLPVV